MCFLGVQPSAVGSCALLQATGVSTVFHLWLNWVREKWKSVHNHWSQCHPQVSNFVCMSRITLSKLNHSTHWQVLFVTINECWVWPAELTCCGMDDHGETADYSFARKEYRRHCIRQRNGKNNYMPHHINSSSPLLLFWTCLPRQLCFLFVLLALAPNQWAVFFFDMYCLCWHQGKGKLCLLLHRHPTRGSTIFSVCTACVGIQP